MARDHDENLDDSQNESQENLDHSISDDSLNRSQVRKRKKKKPPRIMRGRVSFCPKSNTSSSSFNRSKRRSSGKNATNYQYKKINAQLAQTCNNIKVELNHVKEELLMVKGEKLTLQTENAALRGQVDPQVVEQEVQKRVLECVGPVKDCLNAALDNMVGLSDNLTQGLRLTTAPSRMSLNRQSTSSVALNSRNSSIGSGNPPSFRMRNATNFPPPSSSSPNKDLPKSMVSPMVAGHTIKRPRIQLNRIAMLGGVGGVYVGTNPVQPAAPPQEEEPPEDEMEEDVVEDEPEEDLAEIGASPDQPRRNRFNLTIIGEESRIEESPLPTSQPMERLDESDEDDGVEVLSGNVVDADVSLLQTPLNSSTSRSGRRSRVSLAPIPGPSTQDIDQDVSIRRRSRTADSQRLSSVRQRLKDRTSSVGLSRASSASMSRSPADSISRASSASMSRSPNISLSRSPAGSPANTSGVRLSRSPYVDVMKTARHPHVLLSDLVMSRHSGALGASSSQSPNISRHSGASSSQSPNILASRPSSTPVIADTIEDDIENEEEVVGDAYDMNNIPANPSDSFLERLCDENPMEGPSWLFATIKKKKVKRGRGKVTAARKLSTVLSLGSGESSSSVRTTLSFDTSDLSTDRTTDDSEVSGFVPGGNILDADLEINNQSEETRLDAIDMDETEAQGMGVDEEGEEDKENTSGEGDEDFIMVDGERTPLKELVFMNGGAAVRYNPEIEDGVTVESLKEAKILLDNIGVKGRRYSVEQEENPLHSARVRLSECYIDLSGGGACLVAPLDQMVNISGMEAQEMESEEEQRSVGRKRKFSSFADASFNNLETASKHGRKNVRHSDALLNGHAEVREDENNDLEHEDKKKRLEERKSKAFLPAFIPFTPTKTKKTKEKTQRKPRSKAAAKLLEIEDENEEVEESQQPSTSSSGEKELENVTVEEEVEKETSETVVNSVESNQDISEDLDLIESPVQTPPKKKKGKSTISRARISDFENLSPERRKSQETQVVEQNNDNIETDLPIEEEIEDSSQNAIEEIPPTKKPRTMSGNKNESKSPEEPLEQTEVEPEPSKNPRARNISGSRKKATSETFKPIETEETFRRPRGRTTMAVNYAELDDSLSQELVKKGRSRNNSGKNAKTNVEIPSGSSEKASTNNEGANELAEDEKLQSSEPKSKETKKSSKKVSTEEKDNTNDEGTSKVAEDEKPQSSGAEISEPNSKEPKKTSKKVSTEEVKPSSEEVKDEGRSRRRATGSVSYKEPSIGKKLRQGDQHSASVYADFVPQTKAKGKKKK